MSLKQHLDVTHPLSHRCTSTYVTISPFRQANLSKTPMFQIRISLRSLTVHVLQTVMSARKHLVYGRV